MGIKSILQTIGTVITIVLIIVTTEVTRYAHNLEQFSSSLDLTQFILTIATIGFAMVTGFSYFNSRYEHEGLTYILYACLGVAHFILAPIAFVIANMKIEFGQYWWAVLIGIVVLLIGGNGYKDARN